MFLQQPRFQLLEAWGLGAGFCFHSEVHVSLPKLPERLYSVPSSFMKQGWVWGRGRRGANGLISTARGGLTGLESS
jgi:hypothetical protein